MSQSSSRDVRSARHAATVAVTGLLLGIASAIPGIDIVRLGPFRIWHVVILLAFVYAASRVGSTKVGQYRISSMDVGMVLFVVAMTLLENVNAGDLDFAANYGSTIAPAFYLIGYAIARLTVRTLRDVGTFLWWFILAGIPSALIAILQFVSPAFGQWTVAIASGEGLERRLSGDGLLRAAGLFGHWTGAGFYFCAVIAASIVALTLANATRRSAIMPVAVLLLSSAAVLTTLTYSVIATAAALLILFAFSAANKVPAILLTLVAIAGSIPLASDALSERADEQATGGSRSPLPDWVPSTLRYRYNVWTEQTIPAIDQRPAMGWGTGVLTDEDPSRIIPPSLIWDSAESQWFTIALTFGIPVMLLLAFLALLAWKDTMKASTKTIRVLRPFSVLTFMAIVSSFTVPVFTNRGFPLPFWIILGVVTAVIHADSKELWEGLEEYRELLEQKSTNTSTPARRGSDLT